jgi:diguanylate cyclase (GGDEF)-like protein
VDFDFFPPEIAQRFIDSDQRVLASSHPFVTEEITIDRHGNTNHWFTTKFPYTDSSGNLFIGGVAIDITERKAAEAKIENLAFYDPLTGLPNRRLLMDRLAHVIDNASRHRQLGALLFIDLDNFKTLNDTLGHDHGDMLLQMVAERLRAGIRKGDTLARFGGDEFVVLIENLSPNALEAAARAETLGERILGALAQPYQLGNTSHRSTPSIGITLIGEREETVEEPLKRADLAMYQAKSAGRNTLCIFDPEIQTAIAARSQMEADLRTAIAQQQLFLLFQPQMSGTTRLTGVEALVRWRHPIRGTVSPAEFIPLAEETGLIIALGRWVLNEACAQLARWAHQSKTQPALAHLTIAVNVSPRQFHQSDFVEQVLAALVATGANPQRLKLELTEGLLVSNMEDIIAKMSRLKSEGVGFSLDDFGTGYSSLAYLKRLPLDQLKIDQSFVRDILIDPNDAAIAKTIIALAESLGLAVIAEGVETEAQRAFLVNLGCPNYQGYLCSPPLPIANFETYYAKFAAPADSTA